MRLLINEFNKRKSIVEDDAYNLIGSEIKNRRIRQSQTLEDLANDLCSVSYLCKIEKNTIKPNPKYISSLCERVNISKESLDVLYEIKEYISKMTEAFFYKDENNINEIFNKVNEFDNYRANIIKLIFNIFNNNMLISKNIINDLDCLIGNMNDIDLIIYALFKSVYEVKNHRYKESAIILKKIIENKISSNVTKAIATKQLLDIYYCINSKSFLFCLDDALKISYELLNYDLAEELLYLQALYYLKNNQIELFEGVKNVITNQLIINSLELLLNISLNNINNITKKKYYSYFYEMLYFYYKEKNKFLENFINLNNYICTDQEILFLKYLKTKDQPLEEIFIEYSQVYFPSAVAMNNIKLIDLFFEIIYKRLIILKKYKMIVIMNEKIKKIYKGLEEIW